MDKGTKKIEFEKDELLAIIDKAKASYSNLNFSSMSLLHALSSLPGLFFAEIPPGYPEGPAKLKIFHVLNLCSRKNILFLHRLAETRPRNENF